MAETNEQKLQRALQLKREGKKLEGELAELVAEYALKMADANESLDDRIKRLEEIKNQKKEELELAEQLADMGLKLEGHYDAIYAAEEAALRLAREKLAELERGTPVLEKAYLLALKENTEQQNALKARKDAAGYTENLITRMTGISDKPTSGIAKMFSHPEGFAKGFKDGIGKMLTPMNIMTSSIDKVVESTMALAVEQDAAISNFRKATGATGDFDADIVRLEKDLRTAGVTSAEAAESVQELYLNVSGFTEMGDTAREEMAGMVAVLAEVGVAAADSTKNIQIAIKSLGMSNEEATALQSELRSFAQGINVSAGQLAKDFATMGPQIAAMGDKGVDAFKSLQVTMKETGLGMQTMLGLVGQFDKFDTAGQSVGKLNALLGGPFLNTLELVSETDLGARMEKLRDGVMQAGVSFDELSYYQKKAYTSALGLNSEMELAMFLGNNMDSIVPEEKTAEDYEKIAKQTKEFNDVMEELRQTGMAFAISIRPLVTALKWTLELLQMIVPWFTAAAASIGIVTAAIRIKTWWTNLGTAATGRATLATKIGIIWDKLQTGFLTAKAAAYTWLSVAITGNTAATSLNLKTWLALAAVFAIIGVMLWTQIASPGLITIIGVLTIAMFALLYATNVLGWGLAPVIPVLYAFGGAILMVGLGIGIAAAGMSLFVNSIAGLAGLHGDIFKTALAILAVAAALDDIPLTKTVAVAAVIVPLAAMAPVAMVAAAAGGAIMGGAMGASSAAGGGAASGPPPKINVYLSVDGTEFATAVNKVEVGGKVTSRLHQTIVDQLSSGLLAKS